MRKDILNRKQRNLGNFNSLTDLLNYYVAEMKKAIESGNDKKQKLIMKRITQAGVRKKQFETFYGQQINLEK